MATNGMTINGLNPLSALTADDKIPVWDTGASGEPTKEITAQNMANSVKSLASLPNTAEMNNAIAQSTAFVPSNGNAGFHNSIYRGKSIGTSVTSAQWAAISAGTFDDLFIGDYWVINSVTWRIAAFDYWYNHGDTDCTTHHVVIVPDSNLVSCKMNDTNITTGAYIGSDYYTGANGNTGKATAQNAINGAFGSGHILNHREHLQNATTNGYESAGTWYDSTFELMTERMVYGCDIFHNVQHGTNIPNFYSIDTSQLPLFRHDHDRICNRADWWLRDVASATYFARVGSDGNAAYGTASYSYGVRPAFGIRA